METGEVPATSPKSSDQNADSELQRLIQQMVKNCKFSEESFPREVEMWMTKARQLGAFLEEGNMDVVRIIKTMKTSTVDSPEYGASELRDLAIKLNRIGYRIQAFALFVCAYNKFSLLSENSRFGWMDDCFFRCYEVLSRMMKLGVQQKQFASGEGLKITDELSNDASHPEIPDPNEKVLTKANHFTLRGIRVFYLEENPEGKEYFQQGIDCMTEHFGPDASKYHTFVWLLFRLARCERSLGNVSEFERLRKQVIYSVERVEDWPFTDGKEDCMRILNHNGFLKGI